MLGAAEGGILATRDAIRLGQAEIDSSLVMAKTVRGKTRV